MPGTGDQLVAVVPPKRWPYGPPSHHQDHCCLRRGGLFCDCLASCADDDEWGVGAVGYPLSPARVRP